MRSALLAVFAVSLAGIDAHAASTVFEKADALYRRKEVPLTGIFFGHAGIYLNDQSTYGTGVTRATFQSGQLPDIVADGGHSVIQAPGYARGGVQIVSFTQFLDGNPPWGAYEPSGMSAAQRQRIIIAAGSNLQADYTLWSGWKGTGTPPKFRCDGLVSYAYAQAKVPIPENPGGWLTNFPRTQRSAIKAMNGGSPASARAPVCAAATVAASGGGFTLSVAQVKDDANGSGIDRVEFWNGNPASGGSRIATDEHDSNPDAGLTASSAYFVNSSINPGANLFTRAYDQAGNSATCDANGNTVATSDLAQVSPTISEDVTPPTIGTINIPPGSQSITATWSATDDVTPSNQINFAYAIDVPFDQWDDPNVTIVGAQTSATIDVSTMTEGQHTFYLIALDQEGNIGSANQSFVVPRTILLAGSSGPIAEGGEYALDSVQLSVPDSSGLGTVLLDGPVSASAQFPASGAFSTTLPPTGTLADGDYTVTVNDTLANSVFVRHFTISHGRVWVNLINSSGQSLQQVSPGSWSIGSNTAPLIRARQSQSGLRHVSFGGVPSPDLKCTTDSIEYGPFPSLSPGQYTFCGVPCGGGAPTCNSLTVTSEPSNLRLCVGATCHESPVTRADLEGAATTLTVTSNRTDVGSLCDGRLDLLPAPNATPCAYTGSGYIEKYAGTCAGSLGFAIRNSEPQPYQPQVAIYVLGHAGNNVGSDAGIPAPGTSLNGFLKVPELGQSCAKVLPDYSLLVKPPVYFLNTGIYTAALNYGNLALSSLAYFVKGSTVVFTSPVPIQFTYKPATAPNLATLGIYRFDGQGWERASILGQAATQQADGTIVAVGSMTITGVFGVLSNPLMAAPPPAPADLSASVDVATATLTWTPSPAAATYSVWFGTAPGFSGTAQTVNGPPLQLSGLSPATTYYYRVQAVNGSGTSPFASGSTVTLPVPVQLVGQTWTGAAGDGLWTTAANWNPAGVPSSTSTVLIDVNATVTVPPSSQAISFAALALGDSAGAFSPTLRISTGISATGSVVVNPRATLLQDTSSVIGLAGLTVLPNGVVTHTPNGRARAYAVNLNVSGDFNLQAGAAIIADGKGYAGGLPGVCGAGSAGAGAGGGAGGAFLYTGGGGGGHGGAGGASGGAGGASNDGLSNAADLGSGGGGGQGNCGLNGGQGGAGGGAVLINVGRTLTLDGVVSADGQGGLAGDINGGGGGGAGGTISLSAASLLGRGASHANGGAGIAGGGGGGGGRVVVTVAAQDSSSLALSAAQGSGSQAGGAGTIALRTPGGSSYNLIVGNLATTPQAGTGVPGSPTLSTVTLANGVVNFDPLGTVRINSLIVTGSVDLSANSLIFGPVAPIDIRPGARLRLNARSTSGGLLVIESGAEFQETNAAALQFNSVVAQSGARLTHAANAATLASALNISAAGDFTVQAGATIAVDGKGYAGGAPGNCGPGGAGSGPGAGAGAPSYYRGGGGGGHGGAGGNGTGVGGSTNDSASNPLDLGSGGGGGQGNCSLNGGLGGTGGGAVILAAGGTLRLDGVISADGLPGSEGDLGGAGGGGGAGGTVNLRAGYFSGTGLAHANGAAGASGSGGGGGGIIAASGCRSASLAGVASGGSFSGGQPGAAGIVGFASPQGCLSPPAVPANVSALTAPATLSISWSPVATAASYLVQVATSPSFAPLAVSVSSAGPPAVVGGLAAQTSYFVRLQALNPAGASGFTASLTAATPSPQMIIASTATIRGQPIVQVASLASGVSVVAVSTASSGVALALGAASARGFQLVSNVVQIDPSIDFVPPAQIIFRFDPSVVLDTTTLALYRFDGVNWSSAGAISSQLVSLGADPLVSATLAHSSWYALFVKPSDVLPPRTTLAAGLPRYGTSPLFVSSATALSLSAVDDKTTVGDGLGSGVARTLVAVDSAPFAGYSGPFTLASEGTHTVRFYSVDLAGNAEVAHGSAVAVDLTPPVSTATVGAPLFAATDGTLYVATTTPVALSAYDPGAGSGVNRIEFAVDGGSFAVYASTLTFAEGRHAVAYRAVDNVGNVEATRVLALSADATPPATTLFVSTPSFGAFVSSATAFSLSAVDPVVSSVSAGVALSRYRVNGGAFAVSTAPFRLSGPEGAYLVEYQSLDNVGNLEVLRSTTALLDATPPVTQLAVVSGRQVPGPNASTFYASSDTHLSLPAADPVVNGVASGLALTRWQDNSAAFQTFITSFGLAEGAHALAYQSQDNVQNLEVPRSTNVWVDATPPVTAFAFGTPYYKAPDGTSYVTPATPLTFTAADPALPTGQPGSGVNHIEVGIDGGPFVAYVSSLTFAEGRHTVLYRSIDNVGNVEAAKTLALQSDATPPVTALALQGGHQFPGPDSTSFFASADTRLSLPAADPVINNVASGLAFTRWQDNGGAFQTSTTSIALAEGVHHLAYQSQDNVQNLEVLRSTTALVDATPPLTQLAIIGGRQFVGPNANTFYASSDTRLALPAADPVVNGVASGLALTRWQDNNGAFQNFAATFGLPEGAHALGYQSQDNVANLEVLRSTNIWVDATPPVTTFAFGKPYYQAADGTNYVTPATPLSFAAADPALPTGQPGAGVNRIEVAVDGAPFTPYASPLTFAEGRHTVLYRSLDNVGNVEAAKTLALQSDATPPVTALALQGGHQFPGPDLVSFFASADTRFAFPAVDPVVNNVASGLAFTRWGDNRGAWQTFTAPVSLAEGVHHLAYQSQDNVQNLEVARSTTALIDATPPLTQLAIVGGRQFPGPNAVTFYASPDTRLALPAADPVVSGVASGLAWTRWQDNGGTFQAFVSSFGLAEGAHALGYQSQDNVANLEVLRSTNIWVDATPPVTTFAFGAPYYQAPDGTNYVTPATPLSFSAADPNLPTGQPGSAANRIEVAVDGAPFTPYAAPLTFAEGRHTLLYRAIDNVGNVETAHALALQSDATPPVSALLIGQPQYQLASVLLVSSRTPFSIAAVDPIVANVASGVKDTFYRVSDVTPSTAAFAMFAAPFALSGLDVNKVIEFYSRDHVLNTEVVKSSTVLLDSTPPEISLLSPAACDAGICRVLKGKFPVLGTARDLHFASYVLDAAPGQDATSGFGQISSGAVAVSSGALGVWDASALSGWQTLRLTATDLVQNVSVLSVNVWVGDPAALMILGNHDTFNMPTGIAVSSSGAIYVADREADRVQVFSSTGGLLATYGGRPHDGDDHGPAPSTGTLRLHEPAGVAVDAAGDIFVADTDNNRVLELSSAGQVLLDLGRKTAKHDDDHGSSEREEGRGPGEFHEPLGVAVDAAGGIYVADTGNRRVQVFSSSGAFVLQFTLPPVPQPRDDDDGRDHDSDDGPALGKPAGIALDAAGKIYVTDPPGRRALVYTSTGALLLAIPIAGDKPGRSGKPYGVAVSPSGDCLLVSDQKLDRVLKFDFQGANNLVFGQKGQGDDDHKPSAAIVFRKPAGLALDASGNLYVADRNNESVKVFGLPNGRPTLVVPPPKPGDDLSARQVVDRDDGGTVARNDKASVAVPPQALAQDLKITVAPPASGVADDNSRRKAQEDGQLKVASPPVEFSPEGTKFAAPATLTIPYNADLVAAQGASEDDLKINYWNRDKQQWEAFDSTVDKVNRTVTAKTSHFSLYQVLSSTPSKLGPAVGPAADPTFVARAVYAFPNPAVKGAKPTIHVAVGVADEVTIKVYDVAGREVAHGSMYGAPPIVDDGSGPQYAYEWVWDGRIASGMYFYVVEASKAGYPKIRRAGKLGIVR